MVFFSRKYSDTRHPILLLLIPCMPVSAWLTEITHVFNFTILLWNYKISWNSLFIHEKRLHACFCEYLVRKCRGWGYMVSESKRAQPGTPSLLGHILHLLHQCLSAVPLNCRPCWKAKFSFLMINSIFKDTFPIISCNNTLNFLW